MKKYIRISFMLLTLLSALSISAVPAAGAKKIKASIGLDHCRKAPEIKLNKTYRVTVKGARNDGFIKFQVPENGTYQITVSHWKVKGEKKTLGALRILKAINGQPTQDVQVKTQGGTDHFLIMTDAGGWKRYKHRNLSVNQHRLLRTGTVKLKKSSVLYFQSTSSARNRHHSLTYTIRITRKK